MIQDVDGKFYGREMLERARPEGAWVEYKRLNPENGRIQLKKTWVRKIDGYIIGSGVYLSE